MIMIISRNATIRGKYNVDIHISQNISMEADIHLCTALDVRLL